MQCLTRNEIVDELRSFLDACCERLKKVACVSIVDEMMVGLDRLYDNAVKADAFAEFRDLCQSHPLHGMALEDPLTARAFGMPRGYQADGETLDYIYRPAAPRMSEIGEVFHFMTATAGLAKSFLWRQEHFGRLIGQTIRTTNSARILSVAGGYLRELDFVELTYPQRRFEISALDPDGESLREAVNSYPDFNIRPLNASVMQWLKDGGNGQYDLIYSGMLLSRAGREKAAWIVDTLYAMLAPGGKLILGGYAPESKGRGYMAGMMGWKIIYRSEREMLELAGHSKRNWVYRDKSRNAIFLQSAVGE